MPLKIWKLLFRPTFQAKKALPWAMSNIMQRESSVASLVNPHSTEGSSATSAARKRGKYQHCSAETCAKIGKYASANGNSKAINHFKEELPTLKESTVRTFKRAYEKILREEKKKGKTDATVIAIPSDTRGRPPILCDPESILISLLMSIRSRGGVVNSCVVKATALVLVDSNKTPYLREFEPTVTWVKSNFTRRAGTTTRPPVPRECLKNVNLHFSPTLKRRGFKFPRGIAISQNPKNYCNEDETLTLIDKLIVPNVERKRKEFKLAPTQKDLLIWDVFRGQKTAKVLKKLVSLNIAIVSVPANVTHFFQPLNLTVNGEAKRFNKDKFTTWYLEEVKQQIKSGGDSSNIDVDLRLTVLKPLNTVWLVDLYNHLSSLVGVGH